MRLSGGAGSAAQASADRAHCPVRTPLGLFTLCCGGATALAFSLSEAALPGKNILGAALPGLNTR